MYGFLINLNNALKSIKFAMIKNNELAFFDLQVKRDKKKFKIKKKNFNTLLFEFAIQM